MGGTTSMTPQQQTPGKGMKVCVSYMSGGKCSRGEACALKHHMDEKEHAHWTEYFRRVPCKAGSTCGFLPQCVYFHPPEERARHGAMQIASGIAASLNNKDVSKEVIAEAEELLVKTGQTLATTSKAGQPVRTPVVVPPVVVPPSGMSFSTSMVPSTGSIAIPTATLPGVGALLPPSTVPPNAGMVVPPTRGVLAPSFNAGNIVPPSSLGPLAPMPCVGTGAVVLPPNMVAMPPAPRVPMVLPPRPVAGPKLGSRQSLLAAANQAVDPVSLMGVNLL